MTQRSGDRPESDTDIFPPPLVRFAELFNRHDFWDSHEALEDAWRELDSDFFQGLILFASAFVHVQRGNRHGITAQLDKAEDRLRAHGSNYLGVDVAALLAHAETCREIVRANPDAGRDDWQRLIPFPKIMLDPARVRGDEPEATAAR